MYLPRWLKPCGLCDRVAVLDYGALLIEDVPSIVQHDPRVIEAYIGVAA